MPASDVGKRLREARKAAGLTLRELAEHAGIAKISLSASPRTMIKSRLGVSGMNPVYTRVELWRDAENEADVLCSVSLTGGAKRKDVLDQIRGCLPVNLPPDEAAFLTGLIIQAYLHRAI